MQQNNTMEIRIERKWAMPSKDTFTIKPIKELLNDEFSDGQWCDPFAGKMSFHSSQFSNDLNPESPARYCKDALLFLKEMETEAFDGVLLDPPYSIRQATECYKNFGKEKLKINVSNMAYWKQLKDEIARILKPEGKVICFGWNSMGLGKNRGFKMRRILLVPHGGSRNDTIVTIEIKIK